MPRRGGGALGLAVRQRGSVAVIELDCSEMTIRRDLAAPGPVFRHCPARLVAYPVQCGHGHPWSPGHVIVPYLPCPCRALPRQRCSRSRTCLGDRT